MALLVWLLLFAGMFVMGYPIAFGIAVSSMAYILLAGVDPAVIVDKMVVKFENEFALLAVPLFILAARIMNDGKVTEKIYSFADSLVGSLKGGLAHVNIVGSIIFSGMTGSAVADASGLGLMEIEAMTEGGYDRAFSCAVTAASATIGPIIPPSIPMVLYSMLSGASIGYLFIGGIIPGLLLGVAMMIYVWYIAHKRNYPAGEPFSLRKIVRSFIGAFFPLLSPVILLWGIYGGAFTPTEAAAVAAVYALILAVFGYRMMGPKKLYAALKDVALATGTISFIVAAAFLFSYVVAREQLPNLITDLIVNSGAVSSQWVLLLVLNIVFLILGLFLDTTVVLLIVVPILLPLVESLGIDLVHFGVVLVLNLMIGLSTPPYGVSLFIVSGLAKVPLSKVIREIWPFVAVLVVVLLICTFVPDTVLLLPRMLGYQG
ncbi:MAG: TRAP transporter large permease [Firmicutes bacterium]|jgi:tripartite ATP-independent transporter DctM subunit|nr:TRAP transporter large permease [Bacillota bacterium]MDH7496138.1 TRAP transporter large permease [Bacillota bacterium]